MVGRTECVGPSACLYSGATFSRGAQKAQTASPDAAAVNPVRWVIVERLKRPGLPVESGSGGRTKRNRTEQGNPKKPGSTWLVRGNRGRVCGLTRLCGFVRLRRRGTGSGNGASRTHRDSRIVTRRFRDRAWVSAQETRYGLISRAGRMQAGMLDALLSSIGRVSGSTGLTSIRTTGSFCRGVTGMRTTRDDPGVSSPRRQPEAPDAPKGWWAGRSHA